MSEKVETNPVKIIRLKCLDCCCGSSHEVSLCPAEDCPSWPWRFGKNPYRVKKEYTEEELAAMRVRMQKAISAKNARLSVENENGT